jgi:hypothetical protein
VVPSRRFAPTRRQLHRAPAPLREHESTAGQRDAARLGGGDALHAEARALAPHAEAHPVAVERVGGEYAPVHTGLIKWMRK